MHIVVCINWEMETIISMEDYNEMIDKIVEERMSDESCIEDFLSEEYCYNDIFNFTEDQKNYVKLSMQEKFREEAVEELKGAGWQINCLFL